MVEVVVDQLENQLLLIMGQQRAVEHKVLAVVVGIIVLIITAIVAV
jgi:hypothetical protein